LDNCNNDKSHKESEENQILKRNIDLLKNEIKKKDSKIYELNKANSSLQDQNEGQLQELKAIKIQFTNLQIINKEQNN